MDQISALMDGELDEQQARIQVSRMKQDDNLRECWDTFHLIGDTLRGECRISRRLGRELAARLAGEPTVLAPHRSAAKRITAYALSAAASLSAVAVVGWVTYSSNSLSPPKSMPQQVAQASNSPAAPHPAVPIPNLPSDGDINEYLLAHQEFSPSTTIQGVVPYIRTVSTDLPPQGR